MGSFYSGWRLEIVRKDVTLSDKVLYVRDLLDTGFIFIESNRTVSEAKEQLTREKRTYGVVIKSDGMAIGLVTIGTLSSVSDQTMNARGLLSFPIFIADTEVLLDQAVSFSAQTLVENPEIVGLVVEEKGKVVGVLTRQTARKFAQRIDTPRGEITEIVGNPQNHAKYFVCPKKDYRKLVIQYDQDNPPKCPKHNLILEQQF